MSLLLLVYILHRLIPGVRKKRCGVNVKTYPLGIFFPGTACSFIHLALVVQTLDSAIHRINHYPADKYYGNQ